MEVNINIGCCNCQSKERISFYNSDGLLIKPSRLDPSDSANKLESGNCGHFSIRGYVADLRRRNPNVTWPFSSWTNKMCEDIGSLPSLTVPEFRWWSCRNCLEKYDTTKSVEGSRMLVPVRNVFMQNRCSTNNVHDVGESGTSITSIKKQKEVSGILSDKQDFLSKGDNDLIAEKTKQIMNGEKSQSCFNANKSTRKLESIMMTSLSLNHSRGCRSCSDQNAVYVSETPTSSRQESIKRKDQDNFITGKISFVASNLDDRDEHDAQNSTQRHNNSNKITLPVEEINHEYSEDDDDNFIKNGLVSANRLSHKRRVQRTRLLSDIIESETLHLSGKSLVSDEDESVNVINSDYQFSASMQHLDCLKDSYPCFGSLMGNHSKDIITPQNRKNKLVKDKGSSPVSKEFLNRKDPMDSQLKHLLVKKGNHKKIILKKVQGKGPLGEGTSASYPKDCLFGETKNANFDVKSGKGIHEFRNHRSGHPNFEEDKEQLRLQLCNHESSPTPSPTPAEDIPVSSFRFITSYHRSQKIVNSQISGKDNSMCQKEVTDDIPMEIVELLAKNQHQRLLDNAEESLKAGNNLPKNILKGKNSTELDLNQVPQNKKVRLSKENLQSSNGDSSSFHNEVYRLNEYSGCVNTRTDKNLFHTEQPEYCHTSHLSPFPTICSSSSRIHHQNRSDNDGWTCDMIQSVQSSQMKSLEGYGSKPMVQEKNSYGNTCFHDHTMSPAFPSHLHKGKESVFVDTDRSCNTSNALDFYSNETISALHLLRLMDDRASSSNQGHLIKYLYGSKGDSLRSDCRHSCATPIKLFDHYEDISPTTIKGHKLFACRFPLAAMPSCGNARASFHPDTYQPGSFRCVLVDPTLMEKNERYPPPNLMLYNSSTVGCPTSLVEGKRDDRPQPSQIGSKVEVCILNRNPADFSIASEENEYMIGSEDLIRRSTTVSDHHTSQFGNKRQKMMKPSSVQMHVGC